MILVRISMSFPGVSRAWSQHRMQYTYAWHSPKQVICNFELAGRVNLDQLEALTGKLSSTEEDEEDREEEEENEGELKEAEKAEAKGY